MRIIGIDPGLRHTGWGIIDIINNNLIHVADGSISAPISLTDGSRLSFIKQELTNLVFQYKPSFSAIEQILNNYKQYEKVAEEGRGHIINNFNWTKITNEYENVIYQTIEDFKNANI